jgi:long-subunit acyl-CoA synthetase (AMP-forming)
VAVFALAESIGDAMSLRAGQAVLAALPVGSVERLASAITVIGRGAALLVPDPDERPDAGLGGHPADAILLDVSGLGRLHRAWVEDIESRPWFKRMIARWALRQGRAVERSGWKLRIADWLALRGLRAQLGGRVSILHVLAGAGGSPSDTSRRIRGAHWPGDCSLVIRGVCRPCV